LPIVFITGHPDVWAQVKAMKGGAIDFLSKPVNDQDLLDAIERAVTKTRRAHHDETRITEIQNRIETVTQAGGAGNGSD
jgi:FixJ family two-component response regulator